jgi:hypothetical protein
VISAWPSGVGIKNATLTGMMKISDIGTGQFVLVADELADDNLNELGIVAAADLNIRPEDLAGAAVENYVSFSIKNVKNGRTYDNEATGPDGELDEKNDVGIGYEYDGIPDGGQSPPTRLILPDYHLPAPLKQGALGLSLKLEGAIAISDADTGSQNVEVRVYDKDGGLNPDDNLEEHIFVLVQKVKGKRLHLRSTTRLLKNINNSLRNTFFIKL